MSYLAMKEQEEITLVELVERKDGSIGLGNSIEVSRAEAIDLIQAKKAKHELAPIGEVPVFLVAAEVGRNGKN